MAGPRGVHETTTLNLHYCFYIIIGAVDIVVYVRVSKTGGE